MTGFKCILIIRFKNKVLFQTNASGKYELISIAQDRSPDKIKEEILRTYNLKPINCQEMTPSRTFKSRTYYVCVDSSDSDLPYGQRWLTLLTAANKLPDEEPYDTIKNFLKHQAELSNVQLQFGLREGHIVGVGELSPDKRGLKCECICPMCGGTLLARLGTKKQPHFAHYKATDCDIASAQQTALHLLAKELIAEANGMYFPAVTVSRKEVFPFEDYQTREITQRLPMALEYRPAGFHRCSNVILEKKVSDIIPDIILVQGEQRVLVEVAVTHFIDEEKQKKIVGLGLPVLEVDLSDLKTDQLNREEIRKRLLDTPEQKEWKFLPSSPARQAVFAQYAALYKKAEQDLEAEAVRQEQKEYERAQRQEYAQRKYDCLLNPDRYRSALEKQRNDEKAFRVVQELTFFHDQNYIAPLFFLDIPTTGDLVFKCDRRIWQSAIFDKFIYNRTPNETERVTIDVKKITSWAIKHQKFFQLDWELMPKVFSYVGGSGYRRSLLEQGISEFLRHLARLGFITKPAYHQANLLVSHSIIPPNANAENALAETLHALDLTSPKTPDMIRKHMKDFDIWQQEQEGRLARKMKQAEKRKEQQLQYETGLQEILANLPENGFDGDIPLKDSFGHRWFVCTSCGSIVRDNDMLYYGGISGINKGVCRECGR